MISLVKRSGLPRLYFALVHTVLWLMAAIGFSIAVITTVFHMSGMSPVVVTSGSMVPTIPVGSLVVAKKIPSADAQIGDIVTVQQSATRRVTHRVVSTSTEDGVTKLILKGDANQANDPFPVENKNILRAESVYAWAGKPLMELRKPTALMVTGLALGVLFLMITRKAKSGMNAGDRYDVATHDLVSTLGQELRTPLTTIVGYTELLCEGEVGELDDEQQRVIDIVRRNADRLSGLVQQVP